MDGSEPVAIRFSFDDYGSPVWAVTIGDGEIVGAGSGDSLTAASWAAQMAYRLELDKARNQA
jgi:hypothetical protein